ncbi:fimbria/pilus outer membrane usher protein [Providencia rettgeri]
MNKTRYRKNFLAFSCITLGIFSAYPVLAKELFNSQFLENINSNSVADFSLLSKGDVDQLPGEYLVDIYVNEQSVAKQNIKFSTRENKASYSSDSVALEPCISYEQLQAYGVRVEAFPQLLAQYGKDPVQCKPFSAFEKIIPYASSHFDFNQQRLYLSFPQASLTNLAKGTIDPSMWDEGIPALLTNYSFTGSNSTNTGSHISDKSSDSYFLSLRSGLNVGAWRLRNYSTWNSSNGNNSWRNINTYLQRYITQLKSQIIMGDTYTPGDIFDSVQIRGAQIGTDDDMLADSLKGYAPVVRGIARTNATVTIKQNGYTVYQSYVAPGPFAITDLYPTAASGDLEVEIKESDGTIQNFIQPFASVPVLRRQGQIKYAFSAGQYRNGHSSQRPFITQGSLVWGILNSLTAYGGLQVAERYRSLVLGVGQNIGDFGAYSFDITTAHSEDVTRYGNGSTGQSYRLLYSKSFANTGTDFRLLGYRYSTEGFYTFQEAVERRYQDWDFADDSRYSYHRRYRLEGTLTQQLGKDLGSIYFSANRQDFWKGQGKQTRLQVGYNNNWGPLNYGVSYSRATYPNQRETDQIFSFNGSFPLSALLPNTWATYNMVSQRHGPTTHQAGISGTLLDDNNLSYSVQESYGSKGQGNGGGASLSYRGGYGNMNFGYNYSKDSRQLNYGVEGGVLIHGDGVTLSQPINETAILVKAVGAKNTNITSYTGVKTDWRGYAVLPFAQAYRFNHVELDTRTLGDNVELQESAKRVVPSKGAISKVEFITQVGYRALITLKHRNGTVIPFGASAQLVQNNEKVVNSSIVGEGGQLFISGLPESGKLEIKWGRQAAQSCFVNYQLPVKPSSKDTVGIIQTQAVCQ